MAQSNQHLPLPPLDQIEPHIRRYWNMNMPDVKILELLKEKHIDSNQYGLGLTSYRRIRKELGLLRTRQQGHTIESIRLPMIQLRKTYPKAGSREMVSLLFHEYGGLKVSRHVVEDYFREYEPELVRMRKAGRLKRRRYWAAGVNDVLPVDQHDKWKRFGLALHTGIDPFVGRIQWMKVWWTNKNPKLILNYYLEFLEESGYMPLVTQSDPGTENYGIANGHTALRHWHDPSLVGTLQHRWMRVKKNVMPEITWSQLRRRFTPGFEDILEEGVANDWYDFGDPLDALIFRWIFIPWLQQELDAFKNRYNNTKKRADKNKVLPHGVPNHIYDSPEDYGVLDFKIKVDPEAVAYVRQLYSPPTDPVFLLVPSTFDEIADVLYTSMGRPIVTRESVWNIYRELSYRFRELDETIAFEEEWRDAAGRGIGDDPEPDYPLMAGLEELAGGLDEVDAEGFYYMGGVNNGNGLDSGHISALDDIELAARFSSDEQSDEDEEDAW